MASSPATSTALIKVMSTQLINLNIYEALFGLFSGA